MRTKPVICEFDPNRDVCKVVSGLAVDITQMLTTGVVYDSSEDLSNNEYSDPSQVIGLVRDEFAAIDAMRVLRKYGKKSDKDIPASAKKEVAEAVQSTSNAPENA